MVKKAQLLEDATDFTEHIKGRMVKKEQTSGVPSKPTNGKKRPLSITDGPSQEWKPKVPTPTALTNKPRCKHCDKLGHTTEECWRKWAMRDETHVEKGQKLFSGLRPPSEIATARPVATSGGGHDKENRESDGGNHTHEDETDEDIAQE
ncbi:hypothetical protein Taro_032549 [Colocasia esculenta]|uniref:Uncharacterized protein n=1 Tax=Colocasia esculenta TaxID=4460 RepID=A0A843W9S3_COLES|nr:hypothetical protein [Colocasia esculenta]